ncbi:chemotaxis response regulator protein-glutamate methylesterase [bacterium BMS3Abin05]|nr:chemotaxis response regulator protein-glutamate methylesterase [bacterium BMS3Abin05]GBE28566.1 chemotaxis response regulator protein-glutamate methylesterase [bacterium BMS3Bbin03]HDK35945.1 chemotaxis protein CheB [Bacteroidota bacterium]HDL78453.1 chemotaxis protein CheB [Bacteroidota bacterium]HDZ12338.1 chemotaxis protein CheB [Bacteroidota bacterium]
MSYLSDKNFRKMDAAVKRLNSMINFYRLIAIGSSTGGPKALRTIFENLPADFPVPIVIAQHMSEGFMENFVEHVDKICPLRVVLAEDGMRLKAGTICFAPDDQHIRVIENLTVNLVKSIDGKLYIPSVDVLFDSVAHSVGKRAIGIILTGMGNDGAYGLCKMAAAGAYTIAESEETSVVYGMPKVAVEKGAVKEVLPVNEIGERIMKLVKGNG